VSSPRLDFDWLEIVQFCFTNSILNGDLAKILSLKILNSESQNSNLHFLLRYLVHLKEAKVFLGGFASDRAALDIFF